MYDDSIAFSIYIVTGLCAIMDCSKSWVSKHQRISNYIPGLYAIAVKGSLSKETEDNDIVD